MATRRKKEGEEGEEDFSKGLEDILRKEFGKETVSMIEDGLPTDVKLFISTGSTLLDLIISNRKNGGIPVGKITELFGLESTGKTLLAMQIAANAQKMGGLVVYIDPEHALNSDFAERIGLDVRKDFIHMTPPTMEKVFEALYKIFHWLDDLEKKNKFKDPCVVIVWDSIPSSPAQEDLDKDNPNPTANVGLMSRVLSKNLKQLLGVSGRKNVALVFLNQLRTKIGAMPGEDPYNTVGGKSLPYYASVRVKLSSIGKIKDKDGEVIGITTRGEVKKTRFGPPHRKVDFEIYFTKGVDNIESLILYGKKKGAIKNKNGGPKGIIYIVDGEEFSKVELKTKILNDENFKQKILSMIEDSLIKNLENPNLALATIQEGGLGDNDSDGDSSDEEEEQIEE